jgi:catechol 2,3-dioxygenase-like lactoylglutathione lyase family enzyme
MTSRLSLDALTSPCSAGRSHGVCGSSARSAGKSPALHSWSQRICFSSLLYFVASLLPLCQASSQPAPARPAITGIAYVRVYVADLHASREFYKNILGFGGDTIDCIGAGASCYSVNGRQSIGLAQITGGTPDNLVAEIAFSTPDVEKMRQYLAAHNVVTKPVVKNAAGKPYLQLKDPEGNQIAFVQQEGEGGLFTPKNEQVSTRLFHVGFIVKDRDLQDKFYRGLLGFRMYWHGGFKDDGLDWEELQVPDGSEWIEYMLNIPASADKKERGIQNHFSLGVHEIKPAYTRLRSHGLKTADDDKPEIGRDGKWSWDIYDPDNTRVEFMEFKPAQQPCCHPYESPHPKP